MVADYLRTRITYEITGHKTHKTHKTNKTNKTNNTHNTNNTCNTYNTEVLTITHNTQTNGRYCKSCSYCKSHWYCESCWSNLKIIASRCRSIIRCIVFWVSFSDNCN